VQHVLLIELSATLRHLALSMLEQHGLKTVVCTSYADARHRLQERSYRDEPYSSLLLGWPEYTDPDADEIIALLSEPHLRELEVIVLSQEADVSKLDWVTNREHTALVLWENYLECVATLKQIQKHKVNDQQHKTEISKKQPDYNVRILFVDDSPTVRVNFRRLLINNGYETDTASCVAEGLEKAIENTYDIAIIDYFMPDGTGDALCAQLRDHPKTARMTCAIITGTYHDKVIKDSLDAGAVECMFKNEANELFLARIASMSRMKKFMLSIEKEHKRLEGILSSVGDGVYGVNTEGKITFINPAAKRLLGYSADENFIGKSPHDLFHRKDLDDNDDPAGECPLFNAYDSGIKLVAKESVFLKTNGEKITVECTVYPLKVDDTLEGSVIAFRDVTERKLLEEELKWQATHDPLTKLGNRRYFEEQLKEEVERAKQENFQSALLYFDLDRFKYINDTAGHSAGDTLLIEIAKQLSNLLRESDTLARIGGDEFAIILRDATEEQALKAAELFRKVLEKYTFYHKGKSYVVNASIGLSMISSGTQSHGEALANADLACFIAKGKGRNNSHLFDSDHDAIATMDRDLGWSVRLREALANDSFVLRFQPIAPLKEINENFLPRGPGLLIKQINETPSIKIRHNEVLLRLPDSRGELISPDAFLPTAERFNLMIDIDRWVIKHAVKKLATIVSRGADTSLAINLSAQTLEDKTLADYVKKTTATYGISPKMLLFEITENSAIANLTAAKRLINDLRVLGCQFALDDFGRGFCSFSHLKYLPVDYIKIDGIFIQGILHDSIDRAIVNSVVQIAHSVGKKTIAEYVENIQVIKQLKKMGVDYVQGYYIAEPQEAPEESRCQASFNLDEVFSQKN